MALLAAKGTLSVAAGGTSNIATGSLGLTPLAAFFYGVRSGGVNDLTFGFGAATGATQRAAAGMWAGDGVSTTAAGCTIRDDACFGFPASSAGIDGLLDLVSFDADTLTAVPDNAFGDNNAVHVLALGGPDLTHAFAGVFTLNAGTGTQDITTPGFQADCVIFFWVSQGATINAVATGGAIGLGVGVSSSERWAVGGGTQHNVADTNSRGIVTTSLCIATVGSAAGDVLTNEVDYVGGIANGFQINKLVGTGTPIIGFLALKGGRYKAGTTAMRTDTNNQVVTGVGFQPVGILFGAKPPVTASEGSTPSPHFELMVGAVAGAARAAVWGADEDNLAASDNYVFNTTTRVAVDRDKETAASDEGDMDIGSFDTDGFTLDQDTAAAQATLLPYLAFGSTAVVTPISDSDTGTLTEQRPGIALAGPTDALTLTDTGSHQDTVRSSDPLTLSEASQVVLTNPKSGSDAFTLADTDVNTLSEEATDLTLGERAGILADDDAAEAATLAEHLLTRATLPGLTEAATLAEFASIIAELVGTDTYLFSEDQIDVIPIQLPDEVFIFGERALVTVALPRLGDTFAVTEALTLAALLRPVDALTFADVSEVIISGILRGTLTGVPSLYPRLTATPNLHPRLTGVPSIGT